MYMQNRDATLLIHGTQEAGNRGWYGVIRTWRAHHRGGLTAGCAGTSQLRASALLVDACKTGRNPVSRHRKP